MLQLNTFKKVILAWVVITTQASFVFSQEKASPIKKLTSTKVSKEAQKEIPESSSMENEGETLKLHSLGIGLGETFLGGDFADNGDDSITFDLFYNYSASHSFDLLLGAHHTEHKLGTRRTILNGATMGIKAKAYQFDSFSPYLLGGLGFYAPKVKREINGVIKESKSHTVFGLHLGVGCELRLNRRITVGVLAVHHDPFDVKQELDPKVEGSYNKLLITTFYSF